MKRFVTVLAIVACVAITPCFGKKAAKPNAKAMDSLSYCLGAQIGFSVKEQLSLMPFDLKSVKEGITKGYTQKSKQTQEEAVGILGAFFSGEFRERCTAYERAVKEGSTAPFKPFSTKKQCKSISYSFGVDVGNNLYRANHPILINWVWNGFEDAWIERQVMDKEQVLYYLSHYFMTVVPAQNNARSKAWLEAKRSEEGVKSTESGLLYKIIEAGDMSKAAKSDYDIVKVHYVGRLQNGTVFDSSIFERRSEEQKALIRKHQPEKFDKNGKLIGEDSPIEFPLNRVILGWTEGMKLIGPGGKIILYIPAELAYGNRGAGSIIGPNEALEFEVELIEVIPETKR